MDLALPPFIPTIINSRGGRTRPDNVFITEDISNWITICEARPEDTPPLADHFPIITHLDFPISKPNKERPWKSRATDWDLFRQILGRNLEATPFQEHLNSAEEVDAAVAQLEETVFDTMREVVPKSNPSPYSKRWWTKDLDKARREARRVASTAKTFLQFPLHSSHSAARNAGNWYNQLINKSKSAPASDGSKTRILALRSKDSDGHPREAFDNVGKSRLLHEVFFYAPP